MDVKKRNIALCVVFSIITGGIYFLYLFIKVTTETNRLSNFKTANGLLAIVFNVITAGIYSFYWAYSIGKHVSDIDGKDSNNGILYLILWFIGIGMLIVPFLAQSCINRHA